MRRIVVGAIARFNDKNNQKISAGTAQTSAENGAATWRTQQTQYVQLPCVLA